MNFKPLMLAAALISISFASPGCAAVTSAVPAIGTSTLRASTVDDRGLAVALAGYTAATSTWTIMVNSGRLSKATVAKGRAIRLQAVSVRKAANDAYTAGNAENLDLQIKALKSLTTSFKALIPAS